MAKFVMECPNCKKFIQANSGLFGTGLFARKNITCSCNYTFEVKTNKLATRTCVHCGNEVVFDQSKGNKATSQKAIKPNVLYVMNPSTKLLIKARLTNFRVLNAA